MMAFEPTRSKVPTPKGILPMFIPSPHIGRHDPELWPCSVLLCERERERERERLASQQLGKAGERTVPPSLLRVNQYAPKLGVGSRVLVDLTVLCPELRMSNASFKAKEDWQT